jgi:hypothetical protein
MGLNKHVLSRTRGISGIRGYAKYAIAEIDDPLEMPPLIWNLRGVDPNDDDEPPPLIEGTPPKVYEGGQVDYEQESDEERDEDNELPPDDHSVLRELFGNM